VGPSSTSSTKKNKIKKANVDKFVFYVAAAFFLFASFLPFFFFFFGTWV
jgi:hypothetical protein